MKKKLQRTVAAFGLVLPLALTLVACSDGSAGSTGGSAAAGQDWPRTVIVGESEVTLTAEPERIVVASGDAAALVADIADPADIVAISDIGDLTPAGVTVIPGNGGTDPEQVLSQNPDLVLLTDRHGVEEDTAKLLRDSGVSVAMFSSDNWGTAAELRDNALLIGELTGREEAAQDVADTIDESIAAAEAAAASTGAEPARVLTMMARGDQRMIKGTTELMNDLVRLNGGAAVIDELGVAASMPADPEQIVALRPDVILIEDFQGRGEQDFAELLANPALQGVPAIQEGRIHYLSQFTTGFPAGARVVEGINSVGEVLAAE